MQQQSMLSYYCSTAVQDIVNIQGVPTFENHARCIAQGCQVDTLLTQGGQAEAASSSMQPLLGKT